MAAKFTLVAMALIAMIYSQTAHAGELGQARRHAAAVTIVRDDWGIAHIHGNTDADAVFGMIYAQAEDDFNRVETNYLTALGRTAEADGEGAIWQDLRQRLFIDPTALKADYAKSPLFLKALMNAWADGLNFYLATHPAVHPKVIKHFEPWMALSFSEGSIGGDIESINLVDLQAFYGSGPVLARLEDPTYQEPTGSNGFAVAPSNTTNHHALLLINPHTSFFFRSEQQVTSDQGLNVYGAATWGQFFIYQGFNAKAGWMHTTSGVDRIDEFAETISNTGSKLTYRFGTQDRPVETRAIRIAYRTKDGGQADKAFTVFRTHHGPIVRKADGKWISVALMNKPVAALSQSFLRTKATDYASFVKTAELQANSSNNTIFADASGNIAYLHPQFIPKRNDQFDFTKPVDGANPATDWQGLTPVADAPHLLNPATGWLFNTNDWPWTAAGPASPRPEAFPRYMDTAGENFRGVHAALVLQDRKDFTLKSLIGAAYDPYMPAFNRLIPQLITAYDALPGTDPLRIQLSDQISVLRAWDYRWSTDSVATSLAIFWGEALRIEAKVGDRPDLGTFEAMLAKTTPDQKLKVLAAASDRLTQDFGTWKTPWGEINRYQRRNGDIVQQFKDHQPSIPVPFASSQWGSLASFGAKRYPGTKRYYGTNGNSFVAVVEFGERVHALAVTAGGESGDPKSPHFNDQADRYARGDLREVYFYPDQLTGHTERRYRPGE